MNILELTYNYKRPWKDPKVILNGEDVTADTKEVIWMPDKAVIRLLMSPRLNENGELRVREIRLDRITLNEVKDGEK